MFLHGVLCTAEIESLNFIWQGLFHTELWLQFIDVTESPYCEIKSQRLKLYLQCKGGNKERSSQENQVKCITVRSEIDLLQ